MAYLLTNSGRAILTNLLSGIGGTVPKYIGWGTGTSAAAASDTGLQTPSAEARTTGTVSRVTTSVTNDTVRVAGTITSLSSQTISEVGLFDAAAAGNIFIHGVFTGVLLGIGEGMAFQIDSQIA